MEVVNDATASTFVNSFIRFISRRGCPNLVVSDRGSVFTAAETQRFMANKCIEWKFNLDCAPWQGGLWERLVGCVKRCMKKVIGIRTLTYIELQTIVAEIELILNNRPIGAEFENDQQNIITPNHLIIGRSLESSSDIDNLEIHAPLDRNTDMLKRKRYIEQVLNHFWGRWRREYLSNLRESQQQNSRQRSTKAKVGDIIIIYDEKEHRHLWRVGKIERLIISNDGQIRGAEVKVAKTNVIIRRPVNRLYPLITSTDKPDVVDTRPFRNELSSACETKKNSNDVKEIDTMNEDNSANAYETKSRPKRNAAVIGEMRRKGVV